MTPPTAPVSVLKMLARYGIRLNRRLGQHVLVDRTYLAKLLKITELQDLATILEVGPGPGNLTELLLDTGANVLAVELDHRFLPLLNDRFAGRSNFHLHHADILHRGQLNPQILAILQRYCDRPWGIVSNLPYHVAGPVIVESLHLSVKPSVIAATVQKEVARRLAAESGNRQFGSLTVLTQSYTIVELLATVPPGAFHPPPKVESAIVKLTLRDDCNIIDPKHLRQLVRLMFRHRRKCLRSGYLKHLPANERAITGEVFGELGIDLGARAEELAVGRFVALSNALVARGLGTADNEQ